MFISHRIRKCLQSHNSITLILKVPITTAAADNFCEIFLNFRKKIRYDICYFLKKQHNLKLSSAANIGGALRVKATLIILVYL